MTVVEAFEVKEVGTSHIGFTSYFHIRIFRRVWLGGLDMKYNSVKLTRKHIDACRWLLQGDSAVKAMEIGDDYLHYFIHQLSSHWQKLHVEAYTQNSETFSQKKDLFIYKSL
ncbi:Uncharacterized protein TCM_039384 [Theobroma cacao]|uniref:Uncharacterized protein n=1 Tax=Theobroma cacao TaxID=3641 RepID=A0A061GXZ1_THECC|nr:Uncharacterized protein TCM_039384 [Theobroma cacao]